MRHDGRKVDQLRALDIEPGLPRAAARLASSTRRARRSSSARRPWRKACRAGSRRSGRGWMTAEYAMLPASTGERTQRAVSRGRPDGRTVEIQRLIGRALRSVCDFEALGERTLWLDCDVLQADGGTRCASITGAWIARDAARSTASGSRRRSPARSPPVSVGIVGGEAVLDLDYEEDSSAETDMNVVMTGDGRLVEVQATAERDPFSRELLDALLDLAAGRDRGAHGRAGARPPRPPRCVKLLLASRNENKLRELARGAAGVGDRAPRHARRARRGRRDVPRQRADQGAARPTRIAPADAWVAGEDSGIEVAALGGRPGRRSRRAGPTDGVAQLLSELGEARRTVAPATSASSSCSRPTAPSCARTGTLEGEIAHERRGERGVRLRPDLRPARRVADRRRARERLEGGALAPRAGAARALARAARRTLIASAAWMRPRRCGS